MKRVLSPIAVLAALFALTILLHGNRTAPQAGFHFTPLSEPRVLPEVQFQDGSGQVLNLAGFRGKVLLLNVWATWCPPCREEMPSLDRLQAKLGGPEFEVVALSIDLPGLLVVKGFYRELDLRSLRMFSDKSGSVLWLLEVRGLPTTLLIDREGREIGRVIGAAEWDSPEAISLIQQRLHSTVAETGRGPDPAVPTLAAAPERYRLTAPV
jgi:thiol-disulfide isomerase/thioredoxin